MDALDGRDPFTRATATPRLLFPWVGEVVRTLPGLVGSYASKHVLDPRTRQEIILAVTEVNGCRYSAWIHGSWRDFLGEVSAVEAHDAVLSYARACADAGRPLPTNGLGDVLPLESVRAVR